MKTNTKKHAPRVMTSFIMSFPPISILDRLFQCRYSNSRGVVASSPSFSRSAGSQAMWRGGGKSHYEGAGMLVILFRGADCTFW